MIRCMACPLAYCYECFPMLQDHEQRVDEQVSQVLRRENPPLFFIEKFTSRGYEVSLSQGQ